MGTNRLIFAACNCSFSGVTEWDDSRSFHITERDIGVDRKSVVGCRTSASENVSETGLVRLSADSGLLKARDCRSSREGDRSRLEKDLLRLAKLSRLRAALMIEAARLTAPLIPLWRFRWGRGVSGSAIDTEERTRFRRKCGCG